MDRTVKAGNVGDYYRQNIHFHTELVRFSDNQRLAEIFGADKQLHLHRHHRLGNKPSSISTSNGEHTETVQAIASRNAQKAGKVFKRHILNGKQRAMNAAGAASGMDGDGAIRKRKKA